MEPCLSNEFGMYHVSEKFEVRCGSNLLTLVCYYTIQRTHCFITQLFLCCSCKVSGWNRFYPKITFSSLRGDR